MKPSSDRPVVLEDLYGILARADRLIVKQQPTADAAILFESTDKNDLEELQSSLLVEPPTEYFHCWCIGSPAIYVYERGIRLVELTNHHGLSVRCSLWTRDVHISDTEKWLSWFDTRGMPGPRQEIEATRDWHTQREKDMDRWMTAMPKAIREVRATSVNEFGQVVDIGPLRSALEDDIPSVQDRILVLLEWFGSGAGKWSGFPSYETTAEELLLEYSTVSIVEVIETASVSPAQIEGTARLFGGWPFRQRHPDDLEAIPDTVKKTLWNHVKDTQDTDKLDRAKKAFLE